MNTIDRAEVLQTFRAAAQMRAMDRGISPVEHDWNLMSVADDAGINLFQYSRDGELINNIWVCFLSVMREYLPSGSLKYLTMDAFLAAYPLFSQYTLEEQKNLWQEANWMAVLFTMIPAEKNKGLVLQVIPHLIEGPHVKYITGSGQTEATASRVMIYEREGNIIVNHRAALRSHKRRQVKKQSTKKTPLRPRSDSLGSNGGSGGSGSGGGATSSSRRVREATWRTMEGLDASSIGSGSGAGAGAGGAHFVVDGAGTFLNRRPRSGTGSSSTDGEFRSGDEMHDEEYEDGEGDEAGNMASGVGGVGGRGMAYIYALGMEYGPIHEEEGDDGEMGDFANVLQMLRDTSDSVKLERIKSGSLSLMHLTPRVARTSIA